MDAVFAVSITALYVPGVIPIAVRFIFKNDFKHGPLDLLGVCLTTLCFLISFIEVALMLFTTIGFFFPTSPGETLHL